MILRFQLLCTVAHLINCQGKSPYTSAKNWIFSMLLFFPHLFIYIVAWGKQDTGNGESLSTRWYPFCQVSKNKIQFLLIMLKAKLTCYKFYLLVFFFIYSPHTRFMPLAPFLNNVPLIQTTLSNKSPCIFIQYLITIKVFFFISSILGQSTYLKQ